MVRSQGVRRERRDPFSFLIGNMVVIVGGRYKRHWTAEFARTCVEFYLLQWQWVIGFLLAVIGALLAI